MEMGNCQLIYLQHYKLVFEYSCEVRWKFVFHGYIGCLDFDEEVEKFYCNDVICTKGDTLIYETWI